MVSVNWLNSEHPHWCELIVVCPSSKALGLSGEGVLIVFIGGSVLLFCKENRSFPSPALGTINLVKRALRSVHLGSLILTSNQSLQSNSCAKMAYKRAMVLLKVHWKTLKTLDCVSKVLDKVWVTRFCCSSYVHTNSCIYFTYLIPISFSTVVQHSHTGL